MIKLPIKRFTQGKVEQLDDLVAEEGLLRVEINETITFEVVISPEDIDEFVIGHLVCEGLVSERGEIKSLVKKSVEPYTNVIVRVEGLDDRLQDMRKNYNVIWTECGSTPLMNFKGGDFSITSLKSLDAEVVTSLPAKAKELFEDFKQTGAYHYAVLFGPDGELITFGHDIGRHNAFDKMVGKALADNRNLDGCMAYSTGRLSSDIVLKALRSGIPCVISRSAPLKGAVDLADEYGLTLIGFLRGDRFNLYSNKNCLV